LIKHKKVLVIVKLLVEGLGVTQSWSLWEKILFNFALVEIVPVCF